MLKLRGLLSNLTGKTAKGWIKINGNIDEKASYPVVTICVGNIVIAQGFTSPPKEQPENTIFFSFSFNTLVDVTTLSLTEGKATLSVTANYQEIEFKLKTSNPVNLFFAFFTLNENQKRKYISNILSPNQLAAIKPKPEMISPQKRKTPPTAKLCVITYANDSGAWFPYFYRYYSELVGSKAIYVITPKPKAFNQYDLGGLVSCSDLKYDDQARAQLISGMANGLQAYYQWSLVCDVDEIVVPHPNANLSFFEMLECEKNNVVFTRGLDIVQMKGDPDFNFDLPVLEQRHYAIPNMALCKPHLARVPIHYNPGHHYCNYPPTPFIEDSGFLTLHLKLACQSIRHELLDIVKKVTYSDPMLADYSVNNISDTFYERRLNLNLKRPIEDINSPLMKKFETNFINNISFSEIHSMWLGGKRKSAYLLVRFS